MRTRLFLLTLLVASLVSPVQSGATSLLPSTEPTAASDILVGCPVGQAHGGSEGEIIFAVVADCFAVDPSDVQVSEFSTATLLCEQDFCTLIGSREASSEWGLVDQVVDVTIQIVDGLVTQTVPAIIHLVQQIPSPDPGNLLPDLDPPDLPNPGELIDPPVVPPVPPIPNPGELIDPPVVPPVPPIPNPGDLIPDLPAVPPPGDLIPDLPDPNDIGIVCLPIPTSIPPIPPDTSWVMSAALDLICIDNRPGPHDCDNYRFPGPIAVMEADVTPQGFEWSFRETDATKIAVQYRDGWYYHEGRVNGTVVTWNRTGHYNYAGYNYHGTFPFAGTRDLDFNEVDIEVDHGPGTPRVSGHLRCTVVPDA